MPTMATSSSAGGCSPGTAPNATAAPGARGALVDALLAAQCELTAVERFAQRHADAREPLQAPTYRDLLPLSAPGAGEQYVSAGSVRLAAPGHSWWSVRSAESSTTFQLDLGACGACDAPPPEP
jgi:hypothetical protein